MVSAIAAPRPVTNPEIRPSDKVRLMVSTPIGPTGAATENPMINPLIKNSVVMIKHSKVSLVDIKSIVSGRI